MVNDLQATRQLYAHTRTHAVIFVAFSYIHINYKFIWRLIKKNVLLVVCIAILNMYENEFVVVVIVDDRNIPIVATLFKDFFIFLHRPTKSEKEKNKTEKKNGYFYVVGIYKTFGWIIIRCLVLINYFVSFIFVGSLSFVFTTKNSWWEKKHTNDDFSKLGMYEKNVGYDFYNSINAVIQNSAPPLPRRPIMQKTYFVFFLRYRWLVRDPRP